MSQVINGSCRATTNETKRELQATHKLAVYVDYTLYNSLLFAVGKADSETHILLTT